MSGDTNGGLMYSHFQNSTTAWNISAKLGMVVENRMLENRDTCFLSGGVHKLCWKAFYYILITGFKNLKKLIKNIKKKLVWFLQKMCLKKQPCYWFTNSGENHFKIYIYMCATTFHANSFQNSKLPTNGLKAN
jgi:hypothetical protein